MNALSPAHTPIPVADSLDELLQGCERREPWSTADGLSGSRFERVVVDGAPMVVKYISVDDDWIMRATGDLGRRQLTLLSSGVLTALPAYIDHAIVGCAPLGTSNGHQGLALLLRDVSTALVPSGSEPIALDVHRQFIEHMAAFHAAYWGFRDQRGPLSFCPSLRLPHSHDGCARGRDRSCGPRAPRRGRGLAPDRRSSST